MSRNRSKNIWAVYSVGQYLLPSERSETSEGKPKFLRLIVPLDGTAFAEHALPISETLAHTYQAHLTLVTVDADDGGPKLDEYLDHI